MSFAECTCGRPACPICSPDRDLHVLTSGGEKDRRVYRSTWSRCKSSGVTLCGAPVDARTLGRKTGEGLLRLERWAATLCPECRAKLEEARR